MKELEINEFISVAVESDLEELPTPTVVELKTSVDRITAEIEDVLRQAKEKSIECDSILVIMQRKKGGVTYVANDSMRLETLSFLASSLLHHLHNGI